VLVLPRYKISTTESIIPIKVIEAWALGVPVIVTRHKVFELYGFENYEDVVYCEPTLESVAETLAKVLSSADLRRKLSEKGPQIAKYFDYQFISKAIIEAFNKEKC
jgi:glycosyltransferase involved in cell wall biosynthesis